MVISPNPVKSLDASRFNIFREIGEPRLLKSWEAVARKDGAPGIDGISINDQARNITREIDNLMEEIHTMSYRPRPMLTFLKDKENGTQRTLAIPAVRDRIAARALSGILIERFNSKLAPQSYAYRPNRGAICAASVATRHAGPPTTHVARVDIEAFFDSLDHSILEMILDQFGLDEKSVELLMRFARNPRFDGVSETSPNIGVPQGSPLAPVLSNLYLDSFDHELSEESVRFIRYADDMVFFGNSSDEAGNMLNRVNGMLSDRKLTISQGKTRLYSIDEGFVFLGFLINRNGKTPCREAVNRLHQKLDAGPYSDESNGQYAKRREAVVRGWCNYFHSGQENPESTGHRPKADNAGQRNPCPDLKVPESGQSTQMPVEEVANGSNQITPSNTEQAELDQIRRDIDAGFHHEAVVRIRKLWNNLETDIGDETRETLAKWLGKIFYEQGLLGAAAQCGEPYASLVKDQNRKSENKQLEFGASDVDVWLDVFGQNDSDSTVTRQFVDAMGRSGYRPASKNLTAEYLRDHWQGRHTLAVPVYDRQNFVRFGVIDLDITRKTLESLNREDLEKLKERLLDDARGLLANAHKAGVEGIIEDSGYKGYHVWFFLFERVSASLVKDFLLALCRVCGQPPQGTHRELFPASGTKNDSQLGCMIKLPLGIHRVTRNRSRFLLPNGDECRNPVQLLAGRTLFNRAKELKRAVQEWNRYVREYESVNPDSTDIHPKTKSGKTNPQNHSIATLFGECRVLAALREKAISEKFLTHYERVVIRGILAPLGEEGKREIHEIMLHCENYDRKMTEKQLGENRGPMSCVKIREILDSLAQNAGCNCSFARRKNDYAHPLRHLGPNRNRKSNDENGKLISPCKPQKENICPVYGKHESPSKLAESQPISKKNTILNPNEDALLSLVLEFQRKRQELINAQEQLIRALGSEKKAQTPWGNLIIDGNDESVLKLSIRI